MRKIMTYRQDVYRAIDEMDRDDITVEEIVEFVRWDKCRETRTHYVRDAIRDMEFDGVISTTKEDKAKVMLINKTDQFHQNLIRNPWLPETVHGNGYEGEKA